MSSTLINFLILMVACAMVVLASYWNYKSARNLIKGTKAFRDSCVAMVIDFSDSLTRFELLLKEMKREYDAESGRDTAPVPPNLPRLSGPRHAADPSGEWTGMPLREALHSNKTTLPPIVEECYVCVCNVTGWSGPHCHYHGASIPEGADRCLYLGMESPLS